MDIHREISPRVIAYLVANLIMLVAASGFSFVYGKVRGETETKAQYTQKFEAAALVYAGNLHRLIEDANKSRSSEEMLMRARAVVSARDDIRAGLDRLSSHFNSDIDRLAREILDAEARQARNEPWKDGGIRATVGVLLDKWPSKLTQLQIEVRKLQSEFGLVPAK